MSTLNEGYISSASLFCLFGYLLVISISKPCHYEWAYIYLAVEEVKKMGSINLT